MRERENECGVTVTIVLYKILAKIDCIQSAQSFDLTMKKKKQKETEKEEEIETEKEEEKETEKEEEKESEKEEKETEKEEEEKEKEGPLALPGSMVKQI